MGVAIYVRLLVFAYTIKDFWHDEAFQYLYSLKPLSFIIAGNDVHPPLYNIYAHFLVSIFGNDILMLRTIGATVFAVLAIFFFYYLIKELFGDKVALISSLLFALTPTYLYFSFEFRSYMFALFFLILQIAAFNMLIGQIREKNEFCNYKSSILPAILYVILSTVLLYTHYLTALIIFAQIIFALYLRWRKEIDLCILKQLIIALFSITVLCIPLLLYSLKMLSNVGSMWYRGVGWVSLLSAFSYVITPPLVTLVGITTFIYGVSLYGLIRYRKDLNPNHLQFALYLIVPILTLWLLGVTKFIVMFHPRYFIFGGIGIFVLAGWSLVKMAENTEQIDSCGICFYGVLVFFAFNCGFGVAFQHDIIDTTIFLQNETSNIKGCMTHCTFIHSTQGTQSPYRVYYPNTKQYLISNLTEKEEFTRGGSAIDFRYRYFNISAVPRTRYMYYITETPLPNQEIIYRGDGIYVQEIN
jgi:hypothetical protein